jgi:gliding motility-associated-like protein
MGCSAEKEVTVPTEINAFNGISRNGDSRNNSFKIDCISNFPNNLVKIYNRAGTLVYEAKGYDNNTVVFDGVSNKGLNLMGTNVPDGTYFYVIDKGNGSKPVTGYLEIVN